MNTACIEFETAVPNRRYDGATLDHAIDHAPLRRQHSLVHALMKDGKWRTLTEIAALTLEPEASISARLRDFRKPKFGGHLVERRRVQDLRTWEYRLTVKAAA